MMWTERTVTRAGVRLTCRDWNPHHPASTPPVVLLHGLAGHAGEWDAAAAHLAPHHRVVAVDQRGHGASERRPADVSRAAFVADVRAVCEQLGVQRPVLVGQSLGGHTAMLTAAAHPELVRGLVLVEAGEAWAAGLEQRADGWHPRFERSVMVAAITENSTRAWWPQWRAVRCPTLLVIGEKGIVPPEESVRMLDSADPSTVTTAVSVPGSGHDVHLDRPAVVHSLLSAFLTGWTRPRSGLRQPGGRSDPRTATSFTRA
ncbi:alpha/beta fold hydrolase [Streptomyces sp. NPDC051563]|uniref:alpha/beta fold hydrolase n=1 Tax=Streptomyces sp. NPDC051563 TaxID=3365659 RepID=UPI0037AF688E